ncbi:MAG: hypothetical protein M0P31_12685 [Solirubrobacteraceae bacterium]|nr:hypothetical protein [Solirubrobacteraceae bacterium]
MTDQPPHPIVCPRCGATVDTEQSWCLNCGAPARTRMRPTPNWRLPIALIGALVLIAVGGTIGAFVALTTGDDPNPATESSTLPTPATPDAGAPPAGVAPPPGATPEPEPVAPSSTPGAGAAPSTTSTGPGATAQPPAADPGTSDSGERTARLRDR